MAKKKGGGASADAGEDKQLDSNKVGKLFSGVLIWDLVKDEKGGVKLSKPNKTLLGVVAEETADKLGGTVSKPFGAPSMRYLLSTLGLCRVDLDLPSTDALLSKKGSCKVDVVLSLATGSNTALSRIITDYRFVSDHLDTDAWAPLKAVVFTVLEPADQPSSEEEDKKGKKAKPLSEAAEKKKEDRLKTIERLTDLLDELPELMDKSKVAQARREEGAEGEPRPPLLAKEDTHWIVPGKDRALYCLLLSTTLRRHQGGEAKLVLPKSTEKLECGIPPQAYLYMHRLSEKLPPADQDEALKEDAKAEQELLEEHRNLLLEGSVVVAPVQAAQGGGGGGGSAASAAPPVPAPLVALLPHAKAVELLKPDTPVVKYMLSNPHRLEKLRAWEGVNGLLGVLSGRRLVFVRYFDDFEYLSNDGDVPFSRLGYHTDLPPDFAGSTALRDTGQRAGRVAVCNEVASPFKAEGMPWEREGRRLVFDATGTQLLGKLNGQGQVVPLPGLSEALHAALQDELNTHQVPKARLSDPGWLVDFHQEAIMPLPTEEMANTGLVPNASVDMQLDSETETEGGAAERGRDTKRTRDVFESDGVVVCNNRLTSGDLASLVMVHYLWSGPRVVTTPQAPNLLAPLPVVWELPKTLLTGLLGDKSLAERVYKRLLRPSGDSEVFFLQDLLTLFNGCGWAGRLKQDADTFIKTRWTPLLSHMPQGFLLTLPPHAPSPAPLPPARSLTSRNMSTSEPMTLSLHYVGKEGEDEQHARIDYDATATGVKAFIVDLPEDMKGMLTAGRVDPTDLVEVVRALRTPATKAIMQEGATKTEKKSSYHYRGKNKEQQGAQTRQRTSSSGSGA